MPRRLARKAVIEPEEAVEEEAVEEAEEETTVEEWRPTPLLYNVTDACFILGNISKQMLYRLIHLGLIEPVKIGTRSLFTMEELQRFVDERVQERAAG
jgi:Helix-turn-helix domain